MQGSRTELFHLTEDPGETLDYGYQKQVELLQNVKKGIADGAIDIVIVENSVRFLMRLI